MASQKEYVGLLKLHSDIDIEKVLKIFSEFQGEIYQTPPLKAAVSRQTRKRRVYALKLLEKDGTLVVFRALVDAGTYIRKLCFDMGEALGVGMSMVELRRIRSGQFTEEDAYTLNQLVYSMQKYRQGDDHSVYDLFLPVEKALQDKPVIVVRQTAVQNLYRGAPLTAPGVLCVSKTLQPSTEAAVFSQEGELVEVARVDKGLSEIVSAKSGVIAVPVRVMQPIRVSRPNC